jgi:hypothetical protein
MHTTPTAETVTTVAYAIACCDFRVTIQRYVTSQGRPWIITVGEVSWQRHIVVESVAADGSDAVLAILTPEQSQHFGYDISTRNIDRRTSLKELIAAAYTGVKSALYPERQAA